MELTYSTVPTASEEISVNYGSGKNTEGQKGDGSKTKFTFTVPAGNTDLTVTVNKASTFTVSGPTVTVTNANGLTVAAVVDKESGVQNEVVTVTLTIKGKATAATKLDLTATSGTVVGYLAPSIPAGVDLKSATSVEIASGMNFGDTGVTVKAEVKIGTANLTDITITQDNV